MHLAVYGIVVILYRGVAKHVPHINTNYTKHAAVLLTTSSLFVVSHFLPLFFYYNCGIQYINNEILYKYMIYNYFIINYIF